MFRQGNHFSYSLSISFMLFPFKDASPEEPTKKRLEQSRPMIFQSVNKTEKVLFAKLTKQVVISGPSDSEVYFTFKSVLDDNYFEFWLIMLCKLQRTSLFETVGVILKLI